MNREDEICLTLQGLINGIDYETGDIVEFSDTVKNSLKVIAATFECRERCQQISNISQSEQSKDNDWDMVSGTFKEIIQTIKSDRPNHLVIIQNGYFYEVLDEDATFFVDRFSYNTFDWRGTTKTGFPIHSEQIFSVLREMKQSFVLVSQLPKGEGQKVCRAISDIYDGDNSIVNSNNKTSLKENTRSSVYKAPVAAKIKKRSNYTKSRKKTTPTGFKTKPFNRDNVINPIERREAHIKGKVVDKSTLDVKLATHASKPEDKFPKQYIDEPLGTREDSKKMYGRQGAINRSNKN